MSFAALDTTKLSLDNSATRAAARSVATQWIAAFNTGDVDRLVELYDPEAVKFPAGSNNPIIGVGALRRYFNSLEWNGATAELGDEIETRVIGERSAVTSGYYHFLVPLGEARTRLSVRYSFVLVRHIRNWRIQHHHASVVLPSPN
jgi:uncharacterized protein (TIGR02246 family)